MAARLETPSLAGQRWPCREPQPPLCPRELSSLAAAASSGLEPQLAIDVANMARSPLPARLWPLSSVLPTYRRHCGTGAPDANRLCRVPRGAYATVRGFGTHAPLQRSDCALP